MRKYLRRWINSAQGLRLLLNWYRPYRGAGIKITRMADDFSSARVEMRQTWYNSNYVGTHFGGSLYSMTDPLYMLLLMRQLGHDYIVWDKAASIKFIKPGKGTVAADFVITPEQFAKIKAQADAGEKVLPAWDVDVLDSQGDIVAKIHKTLYVKRK
ncbi:MAG: DUF4442 domain-containing protein [Idiomarina sp.]|nr:DUF4442 domain-containing protein [Idiomarina sp.]